MFGGDEVSAIVFALDSYTCKAGYTGKDAPKGRVFPSVVWAVDGVVAMDMDVDVDSSKTNSNSKDSKSEKEKGKRNLYVGSQALNYRKDHMEILSPIKDGIVSDWDLETDGRRSGVVLEMAEEEDATEKRS
ncbi:actin-related protein 4-like [Brassica napus]|uniref:Uncharacterized protein n=1 Tax=Brassica carinata TaxID=52824 RepID=A0A8X7PSN3_BRACI|nr:PREDICTED: actin-related protein 4-like [Brassica oleracea var. oleracea]XP_013602823.1 PREDICTED: actin-related protein 4-like [Brassica oleracea var. oleracea]XP_013602825.1 PREDICTED: actin-related protein 4-like [Brassica oleracea var. oleracea]XP_013602826.1 PREDICTED: actin-related protein 4-like [Brassica oleracea var. oleracea]XP_013602827.1 PREDICTED: actin-related protein 4-like [Brassica oleracea var. oleracea]XP_013602828.1 PREDICTED: actin-related protein 4-like [Brassica olera